jgi:WD40 repeat protein
MKAETNFLHVRYCWSIQTISFFLGSLLALIQCADGLGQEKKSLQKASHEIRQVTFSPDGTKLIGSGRGAVTWVWDVGTGNILHLLEGEPGGKASGTRHHLVNGGKHLITQCNRIQNRETAICYRYWNLENFRLEQSKICPFKPWTGYLSPGGKYVVLHDISEHTISIWHFQNEKELHLLKGHQALITDMAVSPNGKLLASGDLKGTLKIWDMRTGKELATLAGHDSPVSPLVFSADSKRLASTDNQAVIRLWDMDTPKEIENWYSGTIKVSSMAFSPDGKQLAVGGWRGKIIVWQLNPRKELAAWTGHSDDVNTVAFSPDGKLIATGCWDKTVKLWDVPKGK